MRTKMLPKTWTPKGKWDVVAVNIATNKVRLLDSGRDEENAEAIVKMAVMRRGVDEEFFAAVPEGYYRHNETWRGWEPTL